MVVVDALAHLDGDRDVLGGADGRAHDVAEQHPAPRQRRAAALAGHLGHRAAEVEVDVARVGEVLVDQHLDRPADGRRVDAVELDGERVLLVGGRADHPQRLRVALDQRAGGDHLADVEAGAELAAQRPERRVGDAGHRREHHGGVDGERPEPQRRERRRRRLEGGGHGTQSRRRGQRHPRWRAAVWQPALGMGITDWDHNSWYHRLLLRSGARRARSACSTSAAARARWPGSWRRRSRTWTASTGRPEMIEAARRDGTAERHLQRRRRPDLRPTAGLLRRRPQLGGAAPPAAGRGAAPDGGLAPARRRPGRGRPPPRRPAPRAAGGRGRRRRAPHAGPGVRRGPAGHRRRPAPPRGHPRRHAGGRTAR